MKKIASILLILAMAFSTAAFAREQTPEEQAHGIFDDLADMYDSLMYFLEQKQTTWTALLTATPSDVNKDWFFQNIVAYTNEERYDSIIFFGMNSGFTLAEVTYPEIYDTLFLPLYDRAGHTVDGLWAACVGFTMMVFYDEGLPARLEEAKAAIKDMMANSPDYPYLTNLQDLYKKTSQLLDYANESTDSYVLTQQRISDFAQIRREIKSDFDFIFDWPDYQYDPPEMTDAFRTIIQGRKEAAEAAEAAETVEKQPLYEKAIQLEQSGNRVEANGLFAMLGDYKDSAEHFDARYCDASFPFIIRSGLGPVKYGSYYVYLDTRGNAKFAGEWEWADSFSNGLAGVMKGGKRGYVNLEGEIAIPMEWEIAQAFGADGLACVYKDNQWYQIDLTGKVVKKLSGNPSVNFADQPDGYWTPVGSSYFDNTGEVVLWVDCDRAYDFAGDYAVIKKGSKYGVIDRKGEIVVSCEYDTIGNGGDVFMLIKDGELTIVDAEGDTLY